MFVRLIRRVVKLEMFKINDPIVGTPMGGQYKHIQRYREYIRQSGCSMGHPPIILMQLFSLQPSGLEGGGQSSRYMGPDLKCRIQSIFQHGYIGTQTVNGLVDTHRRSTIRSHPARQVRGNT